MTFRGRLVLVAAIAVVIAVLGACAAAYVQSRGSLIGSLDGTLRSTAQTLLTTTNFHREPPSGVNYQFITAQGTRLIQRGAPAATATVGPRIPVTSQAESVAAGHAANYSATVTLGGKPYRELVVSAGTRAVTTGALRPTVEPVGLEVVLPLTSVDSQLAHLRWVLVGIAAAGIALAIVLAWLVGRTALVPLNDLTAAVEDVAATTDVSRRLDPGGPDELGRLRRAFNHLLAALERSQQAQRQLVLDAGHELRTPLTSLQTNLEVVRRLDELPPEERSVLVDDLLTQMGELTSLVADLSELARGDVRPQEPVPFRLDRVVDDAVAVATTHGRSRDVRFQLTAYPTWMRGQRDRVARAVGNLLDNALKWSPDGGVVEVVCAAGSLTVRDHGPGIAPEDLPHVFDRFYRAAAARRLPGSGLGLAIVAQVAEAEGGSVTAGAPADGGGGATFRLSFPTIAPPPPGWAPGGGFGIGDPGDDDDDGEYGEDGGGSGDAGGGPAIGDGGDGTVDGRAGDGAGVAAGDGAGVAAGDGAGVAAGDQAEIGSGDREPDGTPGEEENGARTVGIPSPGWGLPG